MNLVVLIPALCIIALMLLNVPIWIAMLVGVLPYFMSLNSMGFASATAVQRMVATMEASSYLAIPFFVTAGVIMNYSGISKRLLDFAEALVGHLTGGLAQVNVLLSVLMGGISGSSAADAAMECKILVPEMERKGYDRDFCAAVTLASSMVTPIIPPGIGLIVYAMLANVSVGRMFASGYIPGALAAIGMMVIVHVISKKKGFAPSRDKMAPAKDVLRLFIQGFWALIIPFGLLFALRGGMFTATEAGAICASYSLVVGAFVYKELKIEHLWPIIKESVLGTATVMMTICGAMTMSYWLGVERIPNALAQMIVGAGLPKFLFMLISILIFTLFGMFMTGGIEIFTPLLAPIAVAVGINPIQFGLVMVFTLCVGNMTPPFGIVLFQVSSLLEIKIQDIVKASMPFMIWLIACCFIWAFVPVCSTWLPGLLYG